MSDRHPFHELTTAAYCPRKLYYERRDDERDVPDSVLERRELAFEYDRLLTATADSLAESPIALPPERYRDRLARTRDQLGDAWSNLVEPADSRVLLTGRECRGVAHKILSLDTPIPTIVSTGEPPDVGVWEPHSVRAVAAAKALSWERETSVERAFVEYPAYGVVRELSLTTRRKAQYRTAVRTVESLDGPPPRLRNSEKCDHCEYRTQCGVKTRSLRSLLGG